MIAKYTALEPLKDQTLEELERVCRPAKGGSNMGGASWALKAAMKMDIKPEKGRSFQEVVEADECAKTMRDKGLTLKQFFSRTIRRLIRDETDSVEGEELLKWKGK